jgi:hypothetical protein
LNSACQRGAIPACFQVLLPSSAFFHPFTLSLYLSSQCGMFLLGNKWIGLFFNQTHQSMSFGRRTETLTLRVVMEIYVLIPVIFLFHSI